MLKKSRSAAPLVTPTEIHRLGPFKQWIAWDDGSGGTWVHLLVVSATGSNQTGYAATKILGFESISHLPTLMVSWQELEDELKRNMAQDGTWVGAL